MTQEKFNFEEALARLEEIASKLENADAGLEKSLELFEEGVKLTKLCNKKLNEAEQKITKLVKADDGTFTEVPVTELGTGSLPSADEESAAKEDGEADGSTLF